MQLGGRRSSHFTLLWRHNEHDSVSNHQPRGCLLNRLFRRRSKKTSKLRVTGLCVGNSPGPVNSPHKGPVTRKMFPFDDVIMNNDFAITIQIRRKCHFAAYQSLLILHSSIAVVQCAKFCSNHFIRIWMGTRLNFHRIWIAIETCEIDSWSIEYQEATTHLHIPRTDSAFAQPKRDVVTK